MSKYHVIVKKVSYDDYEIEADSVEDAEMQMLHDYPRFHPYDTHKPEITISAIEIK
jgi:hypothetical protein